MRRFSDVVVLTVLVCVVIGCVVADDARLRTRTNAALRQELKADDEFVFGHLKKLASKALHHVKKAFGLYKGYPPGCCRICPSLFYHIKHDPWIPKKYRVKRRPELSFFEEVAIATVKARQKARQKEGKAYGKHCCNVCRVDYKADVKYPDMLHYQGGIPKKNGIDVYSPYNLEGQKGEYKQVKKYKDAMKAKRSDKEQKKLLVEEKKEKMKKEKKSSFLEFIGFIKNAVGSLKRKLGMGKPRYHVKNPFLKGQPPCCKFCPPGCDPAELQFIETSSTATRSSPAVTPAVDMRIRTNENDGASRHSAKKNTRFTAEKQKAKTGFVDAIKGLAAATPLGGMLGLSSGRKFEDNANADADEDMPGIDDDEPLCDKKLDKGCCELCTRTWDDEMPAAKAARDPDRYRPPYQEPFPSRAEPPLAGEERPTEVVPGYDPLKPDIIGDKNARNEATEGMHDIVQNPRIGADDRLMHDRQIADRGEMRPLDITQLEPGWDARGHPQMLPVDKFLPFRPIDMPAQPAPGAAAGAGAGAEGGEEPAAEEAG